MRVFTLAAIIAVVLAAGFWIGLGTIQESSADAFSTSSTRLDQQERVNIFGREAG